MLWLTPGSLVLIIVEIEEVTLSSFPNLSNHDKKHLEISSMVV